jgi:hypothetical protein
VRLAWFLLWLAAAPGYVDDATCASCHAELARSYSAVGMSRAFFRPRAGNLIEDFDAPPFFHERSGQYFEMRRAGDGLLFRRYQLMSDGTPTNIFEQPVDWILGSGHHARTYLYRTPGGEMYQLPVSWYTATREWRMAPGYDRPDHDGVTRRVRHECMYCHNAYPDGMAAREESYWRPQTFPAALPEGIGCQRCHGPGGKHVEAARSGDADEISRSIVNPARLDRQRRMDICYGCHMQPAVSLPAIRHFGRDVYSFRPGQALRDYAPLVDAIEKRPRSERFEINHHPYRLEQSRCFTASPRALTCLTCHNPHRKVLEPQRAAHYRAACMTCHAKPHLPASDCTSCHMPKRRTQDVVHVVMTDHLIRRGTGGPELLAPLDEHDPDVTGAEFLDPEREPAGATGELLRLLPLVRARGGTDATEVSRLEALIAEVKPAEIEPYLDLAAAQLRQQRYVDLEKTAATIVLRSPGHPLGLEWLGLARAGRSRNAEEAIRLMAKALESESRPETEFNLGVLLVGRGRTREAIAHYERALASRPNFAPAWFRLGEARLECGDKLGALDAFRRTLEIDPRHGRAEEALRAIAPWLTSE